MTGATTTTPQRKRTPTRYSRAEVAKRPFRHAHAGDGAGNPDECPSHVQVVRPLTRMALKQRHEQTVSRKHAGVSTIIAAVDCSRFSPDRDSGVCGERTDAAVGVLTVVALLVLVTGSVVWRRVMRKHQMSFRGEPSHEADHKAGRERLRREYEAKLKAQDPTTLEASRDWYDNNGSPWRVEVGPALYMLILFGSLLFLIPLFLWFKALAD